MIFIYHLYHSNFIELKNKSDEIIKRGWIECPSFNTGSAGLLFERLLGLNNHNFSIPDYNGIEIKTKFTNSIPKITLFNATPDGYLFSVKRLYQNYGYPDRTNKEFKVFNFSFCSTKRTYVNKNIYAKVHVDRKSRQVILRFYGKNYNVIDSETSWSFDMIEKKLKIKLEYLFIMYVKRTKFQGKSYCKYLHYDFFRYKGFKYFLDALENGYIKITFAIGIFKTGARAGNIHDHGTSFNIDTDHIEKVFEYIDSNNLNNT